MKEQAGTIWKQAKKELRSILSQDVYDRWISGIKAQNLDDSKLTLSVANDFYQTWLEDNYLSLIEDAVATSTGQKFVITLSVDRNLPVSASIKKETKPAPSSGTGKKKSDKVNPSAAKLNEKYKFDSFVVGPSNHFGHAASLAVAQSPARAYNPLFIYGGVGLGKTHLMQAIGHTVLDHRPTSKITYLSCEAFTNEYIDALQRKGLVQFRKKYRNTDILLIDDIHFLAGKERMQEEFFHTFNALFDNHKQIVLTCDRPASEIPGLEHRLISRFEWGLMTELEAPDVETRIAILRKKAEFLEINIPDQFITYIAERIRANIRKLEGALIRAASYSSLTGKPLTLKNLEYLLRDTVDQHSTRVITIDQIQKTVAEHYDVRMSDMCSKARPSSIAMPRQVAMYLSRTLTDFSFPEIGQAFCKNHATVLHAYRQISHRMVDDSSMKDSISALSRKIQGSFTE